MNHLPTTDVNAGVVRVDHNVTGLRIGHTRPAHKDARGAQAAIATSEAIANKTRAVETVRANSAPGIGATKLAVCTRDNRTAIDGLARSRRRRSRSRRGGLRRRSRCRRRSRSVAALVVVIAGLTTVVGVLGRTGSLVAHRGLLGGTGVDAGLQRGVGLGLGGKLGLQL